MPQRKTHEIYSGSQKIGEVWEKYSNKTPFEADMNIQIEAANLSLSKAYGVPGYDKAMKNYKPRKIIGLVIISIAIIAGLIILSSVFTDFSPSNEWFLYSSLTFGLGMFFIGTKPYKNVYKRRMEKADFIQILLYTVGGIIGYFVGLCLIMFLLGKIINT